MPRHGKVFPNGNPIQCSQGKLRSAFVIVAHRSTWGWLTKALPGPDQILLMTFCAQFAATVDFSTCWCGWPVFTGLLSTQSTSALKWMSLFCSQSTLHVVCVTLVCFVSVSTMLARLKRTTCRKCDCFWSWFLVPNISDNSRQSFSVTGTCNWSVFNQSREGPTGLHQCHGTSGPAHLSLCERILWKDHLSSKWSYRADPRCLYASVDDKAGLAQFYTAWTFGASRLHVFHQLPHAMTRQHLSTTKACSSCFHICSLKVQPYASKLEWITAAAMTLLLQDLCLKMLHCGSFY